MKIELTPNYPRVHKDRDQVFNWYLDEKFRIVITLSDGRVLIIEVDKGYRFNAHSVPWLLKWLFPNPVEVNKESGTDAYCALVHDILIDLQVTMRFPRYIIDEVYEHLMRRGDYTTSEFRSRWMPWGVQLSGRIFHPRAKDFRGEIKPQTFIKVIIEHND